MIISEPDEASPVVEAQQRWSSAMLTNDAASIGSLMHDDWVIVTPGGIVGAGQFLSAIRIGALKHSRMQPAPPPDGSPRVSVYGHIAVLTQRLLSTETADGHTRDNDEWMTTVFVHEHDQWLVGRMQLTPAEPPP